MSPATALALCEARSCLYLTFLDGGPRKAELIAHRQLYWFQTCHELDDELAWGFAEPLQTADKRNTFVP